MPGKVSLHLCFLITMTLLSSCVVFTLPSDTQIHDSLQPPQSMVQGETLLIFGDNNPTTDPYDYDNEKLGPLFMTRRCKKIEHRPVIAELIKTIQRINPEPEKFVVKVRGAKNWTCGSTESDLILSCLYLSKTQVVQDRLRYAIHVKETLEANIHIPLYIPFLGIASCGQKTILEITVWDLPTEKCIGSFTVSSEGEFAVVEYGIFGFTNFPDTQKDGVERLAREIIERFLGLRVSEGKIQLHQKNVISVVN